MMRGNVDKTILSQLNSSMLDSDDQLLLIDQLSSLNQSSFLQYRAIINGFTVALLIGINGVYVTKIVGFDIIQSLVVLNLIADYYVFNYIYGKSVHQRIIYGTYVNLAVLGGLLLFTRNWFLVLPIVNYFEYFILFHEFNLSNINVLGLRLKTYKYKSV